MFTGVKVLELASVLAGPSVGQFYAELGADVIKVENLNSGGDVTRSWKSKHENTDDRSAYFCSVNWGKRSIAIDLNSERGQEIVHKLTARSEIVIASYKPGDAEKLRVDYSTLKAINPDIIYGQITGYGSDTDRVGYDAVVQAEAGFMFMNGERGGKSLKIPVALIDILAAHQLKEGLLLAQIKKLKLGQGSFVEVSLLHAAISALVNQANNWLMARTLPGKEGSAHPNIAPYGDTFATRDQQEILLAVGNDRQFLELCRTLDLDELTYSTDYINNSARVRNRLALNTLLQEKIVDWDSQIFLSKMRALKIPAGLIQNLEQVFTMEKAREIVLQAEGLYGLRTYVGMGEPLHSLMPPPHFGEHTLSIIRELD
jgi:crotonobetainyl-CoA:carnitine CoA-transferase CaiB-like acyl-CoA transferase